MPTEYRSMMCSCLLPAWHLPSHIRLTSGRFPVTLACARRYSCVTLEAGLKRPNSLVGTHTLVLQKGAAALQSLAKPNGFDAERGVKSRAESLCGTVVALSEPRRCSANFHTSVDRFIDLQGFNMDLQRSEKVHPVCLWKSTRGGNSAYETDPSPPIKLCLRCISPTAILHYIIM